MSIEKIWSIEELKKELIKVEDTWDCIAEAGDAYACDYLCRTYHKIKKEIEQKTKIENGGDVCFSFDD